jgi:ABC-type nitrate/sulfonate/bicarbonate transport system substrate-binding protein
MTTIGRRRFLHLLAAGTGAVVAGPTLLAACGGSSSKSVSTTTGASGGGATTAAAKTNAKVGIQLSWVKTVEFAGYFLADDKGFYKDEALTVDLVAGGPNAPQPEQSVLGGATQFGSPAFSNLVSAVKAGADIVVLGAQLQRNMSAFISLPKNPVRQLKDLVGKKVGGSNASMEQVFKNMLKSAGLPTDFTFVPTGADPSPLTEGAVDVYSGFMNNQPLTLQERGVETVVLPFQDIGIPWYTGNITVKRSFLKENRDVVTRFMRATMKGYELNAKDPAPGAELTVSKYSTSQGLTAAKETKSNVIYIQSQQSDLTKKKGLFFMDFDYIKGPVYDGLAKYGLTDLPDPSKYIDLSVIEEIYGGKTSLS